MKAQRRMSESHQLQDELRKYHYMLTLLNLSPNIFNDFQPKTSVAMVAFMSDSPWWIPPVNLFHCSLESTSAFGIHSILQRAVPQVNQGSRGWG